jgi:hypothetical protein
VLILSQKSTQVPEFADNWRFRLLAAATASWIAVDDKLWQRLLAGHYKANGAKDFTGHTMLHWHDRCARRNALDVAGGGAITSSDRSLA